MKLKSIVLSSALAFVSIFSAAQAKEIEMEKWNCKGLKPNEGFTLSLEAKTNSNVENKAISYAMKITDNKGTILVDDIADGSKEDVMLNFQTKPNAKVKVIGGLYMDELDQTWIELGEGSSMKNLRFDCGI